MTGGLNWRFHHWIGRGNAYIDDYQEFDAAARFTYDALDRLTHAWAEGDDPAPYDRSYAYDLVGNITSKAGVNYTYGDTDHVHAVTALSDGSSYTYDANGNMVTRVEGGVTYQQEFDIENRLRVVTNTTTSAVTSFVYDGDGVRAKRTASGGTTVYVGQYYEVQGSTIKKYYYLSGRRIALREGSAVYYLHADHLGSTSLTTNSSGVVFAEQRYYPYGEVRWTSGTVPTDFTFTGQRTDSYIKLVQMGARWYDSHTGRWVSADIIIPDPADPQSLNRFSYVLANPMRYDDPSGHCGPVCWASIALVLGGVALSTQQAGSRPDMVTPESENAGKLGLALLVAGGTLGLGAPAVDEWLNDQLIKAVIRYPWLAKALGVGGTALTAELADPDDNEVRSLEELLELRKAYEGHVRTLGDETRRRLAAGQSEEEVARWAHATRRALGIEYKNATPPELLEQVYQRNIDRYGDPLGPSIEWLRSRGKSWMEIIDSASRSGGEDIIPKLIEYWQNKR
jgi:RHS repeat-associated protein